MVIRALPLITALAPILGINLAYWVGVQHDSLPSCIPYLDGCTSISSTGRYPPGDRLFRAIMLPESALLVFTWYFAACWLRSLRPDTRADRIVLGSGLVSAIALIIYVSYLASHDPFYEIMRRYGIYLYFLGAGVAQLTLTLSMERSGLRKVMLWIVSIPWVLGLLNFAQKVVLTHPNNIENRVEWIVSLLMHFWFIALYVAWRRTNFEISVKTG